MGELLRHRPLEPVLPIRQALGGAEDTASHDASPEPPGLWLGAVEYAVATRDIGVVQRLPNAPRPAESTLGCIGLITHGTKPTGGRSARKTARCVRSGGGWKRGMVAMLGHSQPKGRATGNPNVDLHRRASPRPYLAGGAASAGPPFLTNRSCAGLLWHHQVNATMLSPDDLPHNHAVVQAMFTSTSAG